jgi:hypothetical protein
MLKTFDVSLDIENQTSNSIFTISQNDLEVVEITFTLTQDKGIVNVTGLAPRIAIKKPSGLTVVQDCTVVDPMKGKFKVVLSTQAYSEIGVHTGEIYIYSDTQVAVTGSFSYISKVGILNDTTLESSNDWQAINDALLNYMTNQEAMDLIDAAISESGVNLQNYYNKGEIDTSLAQITTNVSSFGAKGDGVADDTVSIQNALDKKGHVIITKPGTYLVGRLVIDDNTFFDIASGVILKKKDGTNKNILINKGHLTNTRNKNIWVRGGTWAMNKEGNPNNSGDYSLDKQSWSGTGILFRGVDGLKITDVAEIGGEHKYCYIIADCTNIEARNINFNNESDGLHFQPPIKNLVVQNITGYTHDDMIAFTMGDYPRYALGVDGDIENVLVQNVNASAGTAEHIKLVGSGINGTSVFRNMRFENIRGYYNVYSVCIMKEDQASANVYLQNTKLENVVFSNINPTPSNNTAAYFSIGAVSGDVTIENCTFKQQNTLRHIELTGKGAGAGTGGILDKVTIRNCKCIDNSAVNNMSWFIRVDNKIIVKQLNFENCRLDLNTSVENAVIYATNNSIQNLYISNSHFKLGVAKLLDYDGASATRVYVKIANSRIETCQRGIGMFSTPVTINLSNFESNPTSHTIYCNDGADIRLTSSGSIISPKIYTNGLSGVRKFSLNSADIGYDGLLSALTPQEGDMVRVFGTDPLGKGIYYYNGTTWTKFAS